MIALVVAYDRLGHIGFRGSIPWKLPDDMRRFKQLTLGHTVLMGRKTWDSLPVKPLPGRRNLVVTRDPGFIGDGCEVLEEVALLEKLVGDEDETLFVIGGGEIYKLFLPTSSRIFATEIEAVFAGDTSFPQLDPDWREAAREYHPADERHPFGFSFVTYERRSG